MDSHPRAKMGHKVFPHFHRGWAAIWRSLLGPSAPPHSSPAPVVTHCSGSPETPLHKHHAGRCIQNQLAQHARARHVVLGRKPKPKRVYLTWHTPDSLADNYSAEHVNCSAEHFSLRFGYPNVSWAFSCHLLELFLDSFSYHRILVLNLSFLTWYWYRWPLNIRDILSFFGYHLAAWI